MKRVRIVVFFDCVMAVFLLCLVFQQRFLNAAVETGKRNEMIQEETKRVALTFDDDVIIGLSQEISYKEAVSMI